MDLKLTDYDMALVNGDVQFVTGAEAIAQDITMQLRTFLGECVYAKNVGVPYITVIFQRGVVVATIEQVLRQIILQVPGVLTVEDFTINEIDYQNRQLNMSGRATSINGEIDFSVTVGD